jgi:Flp pilus assembly protein CpaB
MFAERESTITMKRNMVPLLGIAFVVAIISTGVFYGLFAGKLRSSSELPGHAIVVAARDLDRGTVIQRSDLRVSEVQGLLEGAFSKPEEAAGATLFTALKANEPLLEERVAGRAAETSGAGGLVPTGMRAVSIRVFQSESLLSFLRPGSRVDLQAVSERNNIVELRTVLENVKVLGVTTPDTNANRSAGAIVTVLTRAQDADLVALSDAGSKIRVALRNPLDEETMPRHSMALASVFSGSGKFGAGTPQPTGSGDTWDHPIQLRVRALDVTDAALTELRSQLAEGASTESSSNDWRVAAFRSSDDAAKLIHSLEQKHQLEVVSSERLTAGVGRPISYRAGAKAYQLRVQFSPQWLPTGKLSLRVKPEMSVPTAPGVATGKYDAGLPDSSSFLVQGVWTDPVGQNSPVRLFPGRSWEHKHLIIFVSARSLQQTSAVAAAGADRGR